MSVNSTLKTFQLHYGSQSYT